MSERTYSVYLIERHGDQGGKREVTSPVVGDEVDFYDSGVWLSHETGRNFFPYGQVRTILEHPAGQGPDRESEPYPESGSDGSRAEGDGGTPDGSDVEDDPGTEGDPGAEEEMLE